MALQLSKHKLISIILGILTIFYVIVGGALVLNITGMTPPETTIALQVTEVNAEEAVVDASIIIDNPNSFTFIAKDFDILLKTPGGVELGHVSFDGGDIPGQKNKTFSTTAHLSISTSDLDTIHASISSTLGANILGITKTIPFDITLITEIGSLLTDIEAPVIDISVDLTKVSQQGVTIASDIKVYNPNTFDMHIKNININIQTDEGEDVGSFSLDDALLSAKETKTVQGEGFVYIGALNAKSLFIALDADAGVTIAGYTETLPVHADIDIQMPDLQDLISLDAFTNLVLWGDYRFTLQGIAINVTIEIQNPNDVSIQAEDLTVSVYRVDGEEETFIASKNIGDGIAPIDGNVRVAGSLTLPYRSLLRLPDWLLVTVSSNMSIPGIDVTLPVSISEYQDLHYFR